MEEKRHKIKASNTNGTLIFKIIIPSHVQDKILDCHTNTNPTEGIPVLMLW
jgi:hypothetical protein